MPAKEIHTVKDMEEAIALGTVRASVMVGGSSFPRPSAEQEEALAVLLRAVIRGGVKHVTRDEVYAAMHGGRVKIISAAIKDSDKIDVLKEQFESGVGVYAGHTGYTGYVGAFVGSRASKARPALFDGDLRKSRHTHQLTVEEFFEILRAGSEHLDLPVAPPFVDASETLDAVIFGFSALLQGLGLSAQQAMDLLGQPDLPFTPRTQLRGLTSAVVTALLSVSYLQGCQQGMEVADAGRRRGRLVSRP